MREKEFLEVILSSLDTGLSVINSDHTISWVNEKITQMFPGDDPIGKICHRFYESSDGPCEPCPTFQCFESGHVEEIERFNPVNKRWYRIISQPIKDPYGHVVNVIEGVTDITENKQAEEALAKSVKRYDDLVERVPVGVYVFWIRADGRMEFEYVSDRFCAIFQLNREDVMTDFTLAFDTVHPDEREDHLAHNQKAFRERKPFLWEGRFIIDGELRWLHIESTPEVLAKGDTRWFGILQDITERKKAEEELKKIQWLLEKEKVDSQKTAKNYIPDYGDVTKLNNERTILDNVGAETLKTLCSDIMDLLDTSIAVYEKNGDYAFGQFDSTWCQAMDLASFRLCKTQDTKEALNCGKWLCHENCWNDSAKEAIKTQKSTDIECIGGIHLYAVPIYAGKNLIGVVNMGYGNPPTDERTLRELVKKYQIEYEVLIENATKYKARPPFIIKNAKKRLHTVAQLIGQIVDSAQKERQIKKAKEKAEKSEHLFRTMFSEAPLGIALINSLNGKIYEVNKKFAEIAGRTKEELSTIDWMSITHPDDVQEDLDNMSLLNAGKIKSFNMQKRYIKPDDSYVWINMTIAPIIVADKQKPRHLCMIEDITQRKKVEHALKENENKLKHIIENSTNIFYSHTADHEITFVSPQVLDLLGYEPEEMKRRWTELVTDNPINEEGFKRTEEAIKTGKRQPAYQLEIERKDGEKIIVEVREKPVTENGRVVSIVGSLADITKRKQAEDALHKSHERLLAVLNSIDAAIHVADMQNYKVLFMNKYMINTFGKDMTGEVCWKAFRGEAKRCSYCHNDQLIDENGKPTGVYTWQDQNPITGKWYINYDRAIEWTDGRLVKIQIATDITEMKQIEDQLRQAHKMEAIGALAGGIAHEFNNVLGIILGNTELAMDDVPDWNPAKESLKEIHTASMRAKEVVRQILSFARKTMTRLKPIEINTIVRECLKFMRASIPTMIEIKSNIPSEPQMILGDPTEIQQIVINLCNNAAYAMREKGGKLELDLSLVSLDKDAASRWEELKPGDFVKLTVKDSGKGMTPDVLKKVFDPYFTTKEFGEGTGMGLAVVYGLVKKCNGAIQFRSTVGEGTIVEILFPKIEQIAESQVVNKEALPKGTERILLVDDDESIVRMVAQMLERLGYSVLGMTDSTAALAHFRSNPDAFDLVIMDMAMPHMAGDQLAAELIKVKGSVPILLCTGHSYTIDEEKAKQIGIKGFAMKPLDKGKLAKAVRAALDG